MKILHFTLLIIMCITVVACDSDRVYEQNIEIKNNQWAVNNVLTYNFQIDDASTRYNLLYNVRYSLDYPFYNLYITYYLLDSTGKQLSSDLHNMNLMDATTGKPLGSGLGDLFDQRIYALREVKFPYKGKYSLQVKQYMRQNPLPGISAFGIRIENAQ